ncbi:MAG: hypothetical protein ACR2HM_11370, partial [Acidimicrobiales bacterium]
LVGLKGAASQKNAAQARRAAERRARKKQAAAAAEAKSPAPSAEAAAEAKAPAPSAEAAAEAPAVVDTQVGAGAPVAEAEAMAVAPGADAPVGPAGTAAAATIDTADDGGPPTMAVPPPEAPRTKPQAPAIAGLLAEDLWGPAPGDAARSDPVAGVDDAASEPAAAEPAGAEAPGDDAQTVTAWAPFDTGSTPAVGEELPQTGPAPGAAIPPVPPAELSFWDLFPEDLPPARATDLPDDLLIDSLALPEGPSEDGPGAAGDDPGAGGPAPAEAEAEAEAEA